MPPPGGAGGTGGFGFIKEKPDPWEVTLDIFFMLNPAFFSIFPFCVPSLSLSLYTGIVDAVDSSILS